MKTPHRCPRCQEMTDKVFYCAPCAATLKRPPMVRHTRSNLPIPDYASYRTVYGRREDRGGLR